MEHNDALVCRTYASYFELNNLFHKNNSFVWKKTPSNRQIAQVWYLLTSYR